MDKDLMLKVREQVDNNQLATFVSFKEGVFTYQTFRGLLVDISLEDLGNAKLLATEKCITLMKFIRKQIVRNREGLMESKGV